MKRPKNNATTHTRHIAIALHQPANPQQPQPCPMNHLKSALRTCGTYLLGLLPLHAQEWITPTSVSTNVTEFFSSAHLINGSGLPPGLGLANYTTATHAAASGSNAWVTTDPGADYYATAAPDPVITMELGALYQLTDLIVWGYHFGNPNNNEAKSFTLEFSTDGGNTFANPVSLEHARTAAGVETLTLGGTYPADAVRITITDNHYGTPGAAGGDRVGLGEIRFLGSPAPNPLPVLTLPAGFDFGAHPADPGPLPTLLTLANEGDEQELVITSATIRPSTPGAPLFTVSGVPSSIAAGSSADLTVTFDANGSEGCFHAFLDVVSNDPARPLSTVLLTAAVNCTPGPPEPPLFSIPGRTFTGSLAVSLTSNTAGAIIFYTTDGSLPSATNGQAYTGPLTLEASTQLRAATLVPGQPPAVATESYLRLASDVQAYQSELPILIVENFGGGSVPDKGWTTSTQTGAGLIQPERQAAAMFLMDRPAGSPTATMAGIPDLDSRIGIRVRGAFSSTWNPKPYSIETWKKDSNDDRKVSPLGMPSESDWILYFPHPTYDTTMLGNTFIWELGARTGRYGTRFRFVDVFVNENGGDLTLADRKGVYAFAEQVKRDPQRVDFEPLSADGSTGGWLLGINRMDPVPATGFPTPNGATSPQFFHTAGPNRILETPPNTAGQGDDIPRQYNAFINFDTPNGYQINPAQRSAIEGWFDDFEDVFYDNSRWLDPVTGYRSYLDTTDFIDYFHLLNLAKQGDGLLLSMYPWVSSGERKLRMGPMWDFNNGAYSGGTSDTLFFRADQLWYPRLFADPSYLREHIDRWYALRRGPLSNAGMAALIDEQAAQLPASLVPGQGISLSTWQSRVAGMKTWLATRADWIDSQWLAPPALAWNPAAKTVAITHPLAGTLRYTLDGSDPFENPAALTYSGPVTLANSATLRSRLFTGSAWSAINEDTFIVGVPASAANLVVSEILYNPAIGAEFIELQNISATDSIDLTGVAFAAGITYLFPTGTLLPPGGRIVVSEAQFTAATRLSNGGEQIILHDALGGVIRDFSYSDDPPWPLAADGLGYSLVLIRPATNPDHNDPTNWRRSSSPGGNPGSSDAISYPPGSDLLAYALGTPSLLAVTVEPEFLILTVPTVPGAEDAVVIIERSENLSDWSPINDGIFIDASGVVETHHIPSSGTTSFFRLRVNLRQ